MRSQRKQPVSEGSNRLDQIYFVSAKIFCEKGYDASSMSDIADAVGIAILLAFTFFLFVLARNV